MSHYMRDTRGCGRHKHRPTHDALPKIMAALDSISKRVGVVEERRNKAAIDPAKPVDKLAGANALVAARDSSAAVGVAMNKRADAFWHGTADTSIGQLESEGAAEDPHRTDEGRRRLMLAHAEATARAGGGGSDTWLPSCAWTAASQTQFDAASSFTRRNICGGSTKAASALR